MAMSNAYASLKDVKAAARITDPQDDPLIEVAIETASRMVDEYCERRFYTNGTAEVRTYAPTNNWWIDIDDVPAAAALTLKSSSTVVGTTFDVTWSATDFQREPTNNINAGVPGPTTRLRALGTYLFVPWAGEATVQVTSTFGYATTVPMQVKHATTLLALRQFKRYDSPTGVIGFGDFGPVRVGTRLDPDVAMILNPLRRTSVAVA